MSRQFSWSECVHFVNLANGYLERNKDKETKLSYAINRVASRIQKHRDKVNEKLADIEVDYCLTEKRGTDEVIVKDSRGDLQYTKDNQKLCRAAKSKYVTDANIEIEPHHATKLPDDLHVLEIEAFTGFVISDEDAERLLAEREAKCESDEVAAPEQNGHQSQAVSA